MRVVVVVACLLTVVVAQNSATNQIQPCTFSDSSGNYDLRGMIVNLTSSTTKSQLYEGQDSSGNTYYGNICNVVSSDTGCPPSYPTPVCQLSSNGSQAIARGYVGSQRFSSTNRTRAPKGGVDLGYMGDVCSSGEQANTTALYHISCGESSSLSFSSVEEDNCSLELYLTSSYACPTTEAPPLVAEATITWSQGEITYHQLTVLLDDGLFLKTANGTVHMVGTVNAIALDNTLHTFFIEKFVSNTTYSTSLGLCTVGIPCVLEEYTVLLTTVDVPTQETQQSLENENDYPVISLQNAEFFQLAPSSMVAIDREGLHIGNLYGLVVEIRHLFAGVSTLTDMQFFPETLSLTYQVTDPKGTFYWTVTCYDSDVPHCELFNPRWVAIYNISNLVFDMVLRWFGFR